jgi:hypothetical protein
MFNSNPFSNQIDQNASMQPFGLQGANLINQNIPRIRDNQPYRKSINIKNAGASYLQDMYGAAPQNANIPGKLDRYTERYNNYWYPPEGAAPGLAPPSMGNGFNTAPQERAQGWQNNFADKYYKYMSRAYGDNGQLDARFAEGGKKYDPIYGQAGAAYMQSRQPMQANQPMQSQLQTTPFGLLGY